MRNPFLPLVALLTILSVTGLSLSAEKTDKIPADPGKKVVKKDPPAPGKAAEKGDKKSESGSAKSVFNAVRNRYDENGDNAVTLAEFQQNRPSGKTEAAVENWFHSRDTNQDGKLTAQDFMPLPGKS